jgi:hypothetical protein
MYVVFWVGGHFFEFTANFNACTSTTRPDRRQDQNDYRCEDEFYASSRIMQARSAVSGVREIRDGRRTDGRAQKAPKDFRQFGLPMFLYKIAALINTTTLLQQYYN